MKNKNYVSENAEDLLKNISKDIADILELINEPISKEGQNKIQEVLKRYVVITVGKSQITEEYEQKYAVSAGSYLSIESYRELIRNFETAAENLTVTSVQLSQDQSTLTMERELYTLIPRI